jgi:hypothetical protein
MLLVSMDCPFLTAPLVFSNIYFYITASTDDLTLILGMSLCGVGLFAILVIVLFICCKKRSKKKVYLFNVKYDQGRFHCGIFRYIYPALVLFQQSDCIDWINYCYIRSLTKIWFFWYLIHVKRQ